MVNFDRAIPSNLQPRTNFYPNKTNIKAELPKTNQTRKAENHNNRSLASPQSHSNQLNIKDIADLEKLFDSRDPKFRKLLKQELVPPVALVFNREKTPTVYFSILDAVNSREEFCSEESYINFLNKLFASPRSPEWQNQTIKTYSLEHNLFTDYLAPKITKDGQLVTRDHSAYNKAQEISKDDLLYFKTKSAMALANTFYNLFRQEPDLNYLKLNFDSLYSVLNEIRKQDEEGQTRPIMIHLPQPYGICSYRNISSFLQEMMIILESCNKQKLSDKEREYSLNLKDYLLKTLSKLTNYLRINGRHLEKKDIIVCQSNWLDEKIFGLYIDPQISVRTISSSNITEEYEPAWQNPNFQPKAQMAP